MAKRRPDMQLTKDNFDQQDDRDAGETPVEYTGTLQVAAEDVLKGRTMVKAKRRLAAGGVGGSDGLDGGSANGGSLFSGLKSMYRFDFNCHCLQCFSNISLSFSRLFWQYTSEWTFCFQQVLLWS